MAKNMAMNDQVVKNTIITVTFIIVGAVWGFFVYKLNALMGFLVMIGIWGSGFLLIRTSAKQFVFYGGAVVVLGVSLKVGSRFFGIDEKIALVILTSGLIVEAIVMFILFLQKDYGIDEIMELQKQISMLRKDLQARKDEIEDLLKYKAIVESLKSEVSKIESILKSLDTSVQQMKPTVDKVRQHLTSK